MTLSEKLYQTIKDFPESLIAEVLDFAEFLKNKRQPEKIENAGGEFLIELKGGLLKSGCEPNRGRQDSEASSRRPRPHSVSKLSPQFPNSTLSSQTQVFKCYFLNRCP